MDYITKFKQQVALRAIISISLPILLSVGAWVFLADVLELNYIISGVVTSVFAFASVTIAAIILVGSTSKPLEMLEQIISYSTHNNRGALPPNIESLRLGRELILAQSRMIYDLAATNTAESVDSMQTQLPDQQVNEAAPAPQVHVAANFNASSMIDSLPMPVIGIDANQTVTIANKLAADYLGVPLDSIIGKPIYDSFRLSFQGDITFEEWLSGVQNSSITATKSWERVKHMINEDASKQFDLVASFSSGSASGTDTMLAIFDKTDHYYQDDREISFVALAVHELRTPLTIMRGYIEVFDDELAPSLSPELNDFMHKMQASAQQLAAFVSNILNVARIEENQLALKLRSESIKDVLTGAISDLELRARVHGKHIELAIADGLPAVGIDKISVHEVINNLIDNAIKYSGDAEKIRVNVNMNHDNVIQIDVQDFGYGIPESVMSRLFMKFHRSHKTSAQVGGTGLGLYLSKALVRAHGGNIWVRSKEGEGSTFSFTLLPFDQVSNGEDDGEDGIIRGAHGWIKNHSLYRN